MRQAIQLVERLTGPVTVKSAPARPGDARHTGASPWMPAQFPDMKGKCDMAVTQESYENLARKFGFGEYYGFEQVPTPQ